MKAAWRAILVAGALAVPAAAQQGGDPFTIEETGKAYRTLQAAVDAISVKGTILIAPGRYTGCAVQEKGVVTYKARQGGMVIFDGGVCEGKATLVLRGRGALVDGLTFTNISVEDRNGAGIRQERGDLVVLNSRFERSETSILTTDDHLLKTTIDKSQFSQLGRCVSTCSHSLYIGQIDRFQLTRSTFEQGYGGHYVKSRAREVLISENRIDDSQGRGTSYEIDLSEGAVGEVSRNVLIKGRAADNRCCMITVAPEGANNPSEGLKIVGNDASLGQGALYTTAFVANWSGETLAMSGNKVGPRVVLLQNR